MPDDVQAAPGKAKSWFREHAAESVGAAAAVALLVFVWLQSRGKSSTVSPAAANVPQPSGASGGTGSTGVSAADVSTAISNALGGYVTTTQEQTDIANLGTNLGTALQTAQQQLAQAESQDIGTVTNNLNQLGTSFGQLSQQYAAFANQQGNTNTGVATQLANLLQQAQQQAAAAAATATSITQLQQQSVTNSQGVASNAAQIAAAKTQLASQQDTLNRTVNTFEVYAHYNGADTTGPRLF